MARRCVRDWVFQGSNSDPHSEFLVAANDVYLALRNVMYWTHGYTATKDRVDLLPVVLRDTWPELLACGKALNVLRLCCGSHPLCGDGSVRAPPPIAVALTSMEVTAARAAVAAFTASRKHASDAYRADLRAARAAVEAKRRESATAAIARAVAAVEAANEVRCATLSCVSVCWSSVCMLSVLGLR